MTDIKTINYKVYKKTGEIANAEKSLQLKISDLKANYLIHKSLLHQNHNLSQKTASTKTRSEVRGGGRKPWKQKGTGRARAGSNNSPLWKGGGVIFGPKPIKANKKLNKKEWKLSIRTLLYNKKQSLLVLDSFDDLISNIKTKQMLEVFNNFVFEGIFKLLKTSNICLVLILEIKSSKLSKTRRLCFLLYSNVRIESFHSFLFSFLLAFIGFGPNITPPPFHNGELLEPALARPVPFCFQGLRPPPRTSLLVLVEAVF
jgi:50S ribosomal protein L4